MCDHKNNCIHTNINSNIGDSNIDNSNNNINNNNTDTNNNYLVAKALVPAVAPVSNIKPSPLGIILLPAVGCMIDIMCDI